MNQQDMLTEVTMKILAESYDLNGTEESAVEYAIDMYRKEPRDIEEIVHEAISFYNNANVEPEYEGEDFYGEEANYDKVLSIVKQKLNLTEEATQCSSVASGVNGKIDSFPINPQEMKKLELNESTDKLELNDTESTCVDEILNTYNCTHKNIYEIIDDVVGRYNEANDWPGYEDEEFYGEEADYEKVTNAVIKELQLRGKNLVEGYDMMMDIAKNPEFYDKFFNADKDLTKLARLKDYETIKTRIYNLVQDLKYDKARDLLYTYLEKTILAEDRGEAGYKQLRQVIEDVYNTSFGGAPTYEEMFPEFKNNENEEDDYELFDAREELLNYLNKNTDYAWDVNETYDNCVILEDPDTEGYIEVFVEIKDGNKTYSITDDNNVNEYKSLKDVVTGIKNDILTE